MGERVQKILVYHAYDFLIKQGLVLPRHFKIVYQKEA